MRTIDFSPIFRSSVGFDRMARMLDHHLHAAETGAQTSYPPYNIERVDEDNYRITMAVAGFDREDVTVTAQDNGLVVAGRHREAADDTGAAGKFLHRGIATRAFERRFDLADHIKVTGAEMVNGLLHIDLVREVPEAMKPRTIAIKTTPASPTKRRNRRGVTSPRKGGGRPLGRPPRPLIVASGALIAREDLYPFHRRSPFGGNWRRCLASPLDIDMDEMAKGGDFRVPLPEQANFISHAGAANFDTAQAAVHRPREIQRFFELTSAFDDQADYRAGIGVEPAEPHQMGIHHGVEE